MSSVVACGHNLSTDSKLEGLKAIAIDDVEGCALKRYGEVFCWGGDTSASRDLSNIHEVRDSDLARRAGVSGATALAVGRTGCALVAGGTVRCWNDEDPGITSAVMVSSARMDGQGSPETCAVLEDGTVQCATSDYPDVTGATGISVGEGATCATLADSTVACWGDDSYGQLGDGTTTYTGTPVAVVGLTNVVEACAGEAHSCARLTDGSVRCWGSNAFGQLGDGTRVDNMVPVVVSGITGATSIACGQTHSCALLDDGSIQCWGSDGRGELGNAATVPNCIWTLDGYRHMQSAMRGNGPGCQTASLEADCAPTPVQVQGITDAVAIAAGPLTSCAVLADGSARCWGMNLYSNLGDGTGADSAVPVTVLVQADQ